MKSVKGWDEWWIKATGYWVKRLLEEERPLTLIWEIKGREAYSSGKGYKQFVNEIMKGYFPPKRKCDRKVKTLRGSSVGRASV